MNNLGSIAQAPAFAVLSAPQPRTRRFLTIGLAAVFFPFFAWSIPGQAQTATLDWTNAHQVIDGFGAENGGPWSQGSSPYNWNAMDSTTADELFSTLTGIGVSIYRTDSVDGPSSTAFPDLTSMLEAQSRGALIELALQSPPSSMKYSSTWGDGTAGASGSCLSASNSAYATYVVGLLQNLSQNGVTVSYLDIQNEPNVVGNPGSGANDGFAACNWSGAAFDGFLKVLGPALATAGFSPKVILGSAYDYANSISYFDACLGDSSCNQYVTVYSGHGYGYPDSPVYSGTDYATAVSGGKHVWLSETSPNEDGSFDPNIDSALTMAENIHNFLVTGQDSAYEWWELGWPLDETGSGPCYDCNLIGTVTQSGSPFGSIGTNVITKRYYAFGNWSKFVRPGWVRIDATANPSGGVYVSAFKNASSGAFAIVAVNSNASGSNLSFSLSGFPAVSSVTPYVTSSTLNLAQQSSVGVSSSTFSSSLSAESITTFVGSSSGPAAPSNLSTRLTAK